MKLFLWLTGFVLGQGLEAWAIRSGTIIPSEQTTVLLIVIGATLTVVLGVVNFAGDGGSKS